jgi:hypothetical protein
VPVVGPRFIKPHGASVSGLEGSVQVRPTVGPSSPATSGSFHRCQDRLTVPDTDGWRSLARHASVSYQIEHVPPPTCERMMCSGSPSWGSPATPARALTTRRRSGPAEPAQSGPGRVAGGPLRFAHHDPRLVPPRVSTAANRLRSAARFFRWDQGRERDVSLSWATATISGRPAMSALAASSCQGRLSAGICWSVAEVRP